MAGRSLRGEKRNVPQRYTDSIEANTINYMSQVSDKMISKLEVENSIYFMNNIKAGRNTVYLFDRYGHSYYVLKNQSVRADMDKIYDAWKRAAYDAGGTPVLLSTQEVSGVSSKRYVFTVVREIIDTTYEIAVDATIGVIENIVKDLDQVTHGTTLIIDDAGRVVFDSEKKLLTQNVGRSETSA